MYKKLVNAITIGLVLVSFATAQDDAEINPIPTNGVMGDNEITIVYDAAAGTWWTDYAPGDNDRLLTTFELTSSEDFFMGDTPDWVAGNFDIYSPRKAFKLDPAGFGALGKAGAKPGMSADELSGMLTVIGSWQGGGAISPVDLHVIPVPEPSSLVLLGLGVLSLLRIRQKR